VRAFLARLFGFVRRRHLDADLDDEVRFHLEMAIAEHIRRGMSRDAARAAALRNFGGVMQVRETHREQRGFPWLEALIQDLRYGARTLARTPAFTLAALLTLALGIGANTAIFTVVNAVLLRPLPYSQPDRVVQLVRRYPGQIGRSQDGRRYLFFRDQLRQVDALSAQAGLGSLNLVYGDAAEFVRVTGVSKEYFAVFGAQPALGEAFGPEEDVVGGPDVVILGHALWLRSFGADRAIVGRSVVLGDKPYSIVGVMPASFEPTSPTDVFVPLRPGLTGRGGGFNYSVSWRLRPGV
jgi:hypothetical protein